MSKGWRTRCAVIKALLCDPVVHRPCFVPVIVGHQERKGKQAMGLGGYLRQSLARSGKGKFKRDQEEEDCCDRD